MKPSHLHVNTGHTTREGDPKAPSSLPSPPSPPSSPSPPSAYKTPYKSKSTRRSSPFGEEQPLPSPANTCETQDTNESYDNFDQDDDDFDREAQSSPQKSSKKNKTADTNNPNVVVIEHKHTDGGRSNKSKGVGAAALSRPMKIGIGAFLLMSTGGFAYFFQEWFRIPGLETQIQRLEKEIDRLSGEVDRLSSEVDRYEGLNSELNTTISELDRQNDRLNASNMEFRELNIDLNASVIELQNQNEYLAEQNAIFADLNEDLNTTTSRLTTEVTRLEDALGDLASEKEGLAFLVDSLSNETDLLVQLNEDLQNSLANLDSQVDGLSFELDRLDALNQDLSSVVSFLNDTASSVQSSFAAITAFLAEEITAYRTLVLEDTQNTYTNRIDNWNCIYDSAFASYNFTTDTTIPIGIEQYGRVIGHVQNQVLQKICLDTSDFEEFLGTFIVQGPPSDASTDDLVSAVNLYTMAAMDYYFPRNGNDGLSPDQWAAYSFDCRELPDNLKFFMYQ